MAIRRELTFHTDGKDKAGKPYGTHYSDERIAARGESLTKRLEKWEKLKRDAEIALEKSVAKIG